MLETFKISEYFIRFLKLVSMSSSRSFILFEQRIHNYCFIVDLFLPYSMKKKVSILLEN